nr:phospholipase [Microcella alkalica]
MRAVLSQHWESSRTEGQPVAIFLHGYGSHEQDLVSLASGLGLRMPWASVRAPIDLGAGAAWFRIATPGDPAEEPVAAATAALWEWLDANVPPTAPIVPIGFSQGGLMTTQLLRTRPDRVLAPVILAGFVQTAAQIGDAALQRTRPCALWVRGDMDRVITDAAVQRTENFLRQHATARTTLVPGLGHGISIAVLDEVRDFLRAVVGAGAIAP